MDSLAIPCRASESVEGEIGYLLTSLSRADGNDTLRILNRASGNLSTGAAKKFDPSLYHSIPLNRVADTVFHLDVSYVGVSLRSLQ